MRKQILVIEDDTDINNLIADALDKAGYACTQAFSGTEGLQDAGSETFSLITLDLTLPGMDGAALLPLLKEKQAAPVMIVSARDSLEEKVSLLTAGADDYLTKPFEIRELVARAGVLLRRYSGSEANAGFLSYRDLTLQPDSFSAAIGNRKLSLTRQEFKILELMLQNPPGHIYSKRSFYEYAWGDGYIGEDKTINVHISNIRKKIKEITDAEYIETVWGIGFRLVS